MKFSILFPQLLISTLIFCTLQSPILANKKSYIVYLGAHSHGPTPSPADLNRATDSHYDLLGSLLGSKAKAKDAIFYSYNKHINAFAAVLNDNEVEELEKNPDVLSVFPNHGRQLHTTRSWSFLGLETDEMIPPDSMWNKANFGEDIIVGNLDSGVWPESKSFSDEDMGPIPSKWQGVCQSKNNTEDGVRCNRKLIGVRYFNQGYAMAASEPLNSSYSTARDYGGHGTHTLSTAAGNFVPGVSLTGKDNGTAKGGAPKARVAAYKVCWRPAINNSQCFDADIIAAFDAAIHDGVDVLSVSLGGEPNNYFEDGISIGAFHAIKNGIVVVCSAGNSGPKDGTVSNLSPWIFTVGASTIDKELPSSVKQGNKEQLQEVPNDLHDSGKNRTAKKPAPMMATFSSRGPNTITPEILKPDITAPGVHIIAADTESKGHVPFYFKSGTSMACPHVSGVVALLKKLYPEWSPAAIRSAIMTSAITRDNNMKPMLNSSSLKATPFNYGAGHMRPSRAMDPGLIYDLTINDYLNFLCALHYNKTQIEIFSNEPYTCPKSVSLQDLNYPSITVPDLTNSVTITRTVRNVGSPGTYHVRVKEPAGISVLVEPEILKFEEIGEEQEFKLTLKAKRIGAAKDYVYGRIIWSDGKHFVRSPIVVKAR